MNRGNKNPIQEQPEDDEYTKKAKSAVRDHIEEVDKKHKKKKKDKKAKKDDEEPPEEQKDESVSPTNKYPLKPKGMDKQQEKMKNEIDAKKEKIKALQR